MNDETLDPRRETMIAALYGELSADEEQDFNRLLSSDPALQAEFEELQGTREFLGSWELSDPIPDFVFMDPEETSPSRSRGFREKVLSWFSTPIPSWGFALSTAALAILIVSGFRVDWVSNGVTFRFGNDARPVATTTMASNPVSPLERDAGMHRGGPTATQVSQQAYPATRRDLDQYTGGIMSAMSSMLDEYQDRRNAELAYILQNFYEELRLSRQREYAGLREQMQGMGMGLMAEQSMTNATLNSLIRRTEPVSLNPYGDTPLNTNEEKQND